ncbi:hypothetical protein V2J09_011434 [Rumex salicifolius]
MRKRMSLERSLAMIKKRMRKKRALINKRIVVMRRAVLMKKRVKRIVVMNNGQEGDVDVRCKSK